MFLCTSEKEVSSSSRTSRSPLVVPIFVCVLCVKLSTSCKIYGVMFVVVNNALVKVTIIQKSSSSSSQSTSIISITLLKFCETVKFSTFWIVENTHAKFKPFLAINITYNIGASCTFWKMFCNRMDITKMGQKTTYLMWYHTHRCSGRVREYDAVWPWGILLLVGGVVSSP